MRPTRPLHRTALPVLVSGLSFCVLAGIAMASEGPEQSQPVGLRILAINDLHGHIDSTFFNGQVGGIDYLAAHLRAFEASAENAVIISAGDMIGGSPLLSAYFHDEPTIEAANLLGLDVAAVGNHEFDEGTLELLRMQNGGCHPEDGCQDGDGFAGANFPFLAANVVYRETGETFFPPVLVKTYQGVRVAFIGLTLEDTPRMLSPLSVTDVEFLDEVETINLIVAELRKIQIEAIVVVIHHGGWATPSGCAGPIVDIAERVDPAVDLFLTGHTHGLYACFIGGRLVISSGSLGQHFIVLDYELNRVTKDMTLLGGDVPWNLRNVTPAADLTALLDKYGTILAPIANAVIGTVSGDIWGFTNAAGESALGDVVTDAFLAATEAPGFGDADVAFTNSGGIRAPLFYFSNGSEAHGEVTYAEAFSVLPFGNHLVTMTLTGAEIHELLELQFDNPEPGRGDILQVSQGFEYTWSISAPTGAKVDPATIRVGGAVVDPAAEYRVTVPNFLAEGGGIFGAVLTVGTQRLDGQDDIDAVADYFASSSPVDPGPQDRITRVAGVSVRTR